MKIFWGLVIFGVGILLLGTNLGWWNHDIWSAVWLLWPLIFIAIGLRFLIDDDRIFAIIALILVLGAGYVMVNRPAVVLDKLDRDIEVFSEKIQSSYQSDKVKSLNLEVDAGASNIVFKSLDTTESQDTLYRIETKNLGKIEEVVTTVGETVEAKISEKIYKHWLGKRLGDRELNVFLTQNLPLSLEINSGASRFEMDFKDIRLNELRINAGASKGEITFGDKENLEASVEAGASKLTFNVPKGVGIRVIFDSEQGLNGKDFDSNLELVKDDNNTYTSKNYDSASKKINLKLEAGASSIEINQY